MTLKARLVFGICIFIILGTVVESVFIHPEVLTNVDQLWSRAFIMIAAGLIARIAAKEY
jgi:hypothetical protein